MRGRKVIHLVSRFLKVGVFALAAVLGVCSCIKPISPGDIMHVKDVVAPTIIVISPEDGDSYAATVVVQGVVQDTSTTLGHTGEVRSLSYEVLSSTVGDEVAIGDYGYFTFQFPTDILTGTLVIRIIAEDWNGNAAEKLFNLVDGSAIPTFAAVSADGGVTLTWDPVPVSEGYTIYYEKSNIQPTETYSPSIPGVTSPHPMAGLENGEIYLFMLRSHSSSGSDNWSNVIKAIPLAPEQLTPTLVPEAKSMRVRWNTVPGTDEYVLWKSTSRDDGYINITGVTDETEMRDFAVQPGQRYYYAVQTAAYNESRSAPASSELPEFTPFHQRDTVGSIDNGGYYWWVVLYESSLNVLYAYAAEVSNDRILVYNVTDPTEPVYLDSVSTSENPSGMVVEGSRLYVAAGAAGLKVYSIDDATGLLTAAGNDSAAASDVAVVGTTAYVVAGSTFRILNCSALPAVTQVGSCTVTGTALKVAVKGTYAYVSGSAGVRYINCGTPSNPNDAAGFAPPSGTVSNVTVDGNFLYVAESAGIRVFDVTTESNPIERGSLATSDYVYEIAAESSTPQVGPQFIYAAAKTAGLRIVNVLDPTAPAESGFCTPPSWAFGVAVRMPYAYVAGYSAGLQIFDVNAPVAPKEVGFWKPSGTEARGVAVVDQYAYVADDGKGLAVLDVSDPLDPSFPKQKALYAITSGSPKDVAVSWPYAYVLKSATGFDIFDVSNPSQPKFLSPVTSPGYATGLCASGSYVYVADRAAGLQIYDMREKESPVIAGNYLPAGEVEDVDVFGEYAYIVTDTFGLYVLDVSTPAFPVKVGELGFAAGSRVAVSGNTVYANGGAYVIDVTVPSAPGLLGTYVGAGNDVAVSGHYAFQALGSGAVSVLNVADPANPVRDALADTAGQSTGIAVQGSYVYVADWTNGLRIFDVNDFD